jgi:hypothetical protein
MRCAEWRSCARDPTGGCSLPAGEIDRDHEIVLADLRDHCFAVKSTFHSDPHEAGRRQGRREAWLRISQHLNLDEAKVQKLVELDDGL